jgi:hypothetical protein
MIPNGLGFRHQQGNLIGWLLTGEAIFMLANIAAGSYAQLVYDQGVHALSFAGLPALILSQLFSAGALWLAAVIRQALSWRHLNRTEPDGEPRQQLKWLASGAAVCGVLGISAVSTNSSIWEVLILGFAALPLSIGIGILKYRLYEIDRLISRTLTSPSG